MLADAISSELELLAKQDLARSFEVELEVRFGGVTVAAAPSFRIEVSTGLTAEAKAILARLFSEHGVDHAQHDEWPAPPAGVRTSRLESNEPPVTGKVEPAARAERKSGTNP